MSSFLTWLADVLHARGGHRYRDSHGSWLDAEREGRDE